MTIMYLSKENLLIYYCAESVQKLEKSMKPEINSFVNSVDPDQLTSEGAS